MYPRDSSTLHSAQACHSAISKGSYCFEMAAPLAAPGWPGPEVIPESTVVHIPADGSYHDGSYHGGSRDGSHHGSRRGGSRHGDRMYAQMLAAQAAAEGKPAPLERVASRRLSNAGSNDYAQDYAGDYPVERDKEIGLAEVARKYNYNPGQLLHAYFRKWKGGIDDVSHCWMQHAPAL